MDLAGDVFLHADRRTAWLRQHLGVAGEPSAKHPGGRTEAMRRLDAVQPVRYATTRNRLDGAVTRLSPYLRHRVLTAAHVRDAALRRVDRPSDARKLIQELAWHDYFQRVYAAVGRRGVWQSLEPWKTGWGPGDYDDKLPADIEAGRTGVDWVDHFATQLADEGWLHNHARMWLACYVVHCRRVSWQAGARWFLRHLVDGDPASNNLSWQWVASTFSAKPYFMNRGNVVKYTGGRFAKHQAADPLDDTYDRLAQTLFRDGSEPAGGVGDGLPIDLRRVDVEPAKPAAPPRDAVAWVHEDMLSADHPAVAGGRPGLFVFERSAWAERTMKRANFVAECLAQMPGLELAVADNVGEAVRVWAGDRPVVTGGSPDPGKRRVAEAVRAVVVEPEPFVELEGRVDLKRFSRYWRSAEPALRRAGHL
jgi:deoxyribodipyrimidine photo-lyase